eukprot:jgi/Hompol1/5999/HPOL_000665-RA
MNASVFAQVEEVLDESLRTKPVGILQKHIIVTCNYAARAQGVGKLQLVSDAKKACPALTIIDGSDTSRYRRFSRNIFRFVCCYMNGIQVANTSPNDKSFAASVPVERLGFDELFIDVSALIRNHLDSVNAQPWPDGSTVFTVPGLADLPKLIAEHRVQLPLSAEFFDAVAENTPVATGFTFNPSVFVGTVIPGFGDAVRTVLWKRVPGLECVGHGGSDAAGNAAADRDDKNDDDLQHGLTI